MKSVFGHASKEGNQENEDDGSTYTNIFFIFLLVTSPVYNLLYDKTGNFIISAADDGFIFQFILILTH